MIYDKNIYKSDIALSLRKKWWLYAVCAIIAVLLNCFVYYMFTKPKLSEHFYVWVSAPVNLEDELVDRIEKTAKDNGKRAIYVENYNPADDTYFKVFSTKGGLMTNIFIFKKDEIELHEKEEFYLSLENTPFADREDNFFIDGVPYGVHLAGDYYMLINWRNKSYDTCYAVMDAILDYVGENGYEIG